MGEHDSGPHLVLYGTSACHLCEQAERLIEREVGLPVEWIEIVDDALLLERYGIRIPVLRAESGVELDWPFYGAAVRRLIMEGHSA